MTAEPVFDDPRQTFFGKLKQRLELEHYVIHFEWRDSLEGPGVGIRGVRSLGLLQAFAEGLERLHAHVSCCGGAHASHKTHVYIYHLFDDPHTEMRVGEPFTHEDRSGIPYVGLPSRSHEPGIQDALKRARSEAVHEATHVFIRQQKLARTNLNKMLTMYRNQFRDWHTSWKWLDEATATYMEQVCYPGNDDYLRYCMNWIDMPHLSLNGTLYEGCMYVRYLDRRFRGVGRPEGQFAIDLWTSGRLEETPFEAIERLTKLNGHCERAGLLPAFGEFCADSCFLADPTSLGFAFEPFARFGTPPVKNNVVAGAGALGGNCLPPLAAHYFRVVPGGAKNLKLTVQPNANAQNFQAFVGIQRRYFRVQPDLRFDPSLVATLNLEHLSSTDAIILTVANCAVVSEEIQYSLTAEAI